MHYSREELASELGIGIWDCEPKPDLIAAARRCIPPLIFESDRLTPLTLDVPDLGTPVFEALELILELFGDDHSFLAAKYALLALILEGGLEANIVPDPRPDSDFDSANDEDEERTTVGDYWVRVTRVPRLRRQPRVPNILALSPTSALREAWHKRLAGGASTEEGPSPPDKFSFNGTAYSVPRPMVFKLIEHLWRSRGRTSRIDNLAEPVWGDHGGSVDDSSLGSVRRDANKFFEEHGLPFRVRTKSRCVSLVHPTSRD